MNFNKTFRLFVAGVFLVFFGALSFSTTFAQAQNSPKEPSLLNLNQNNVRIRIGIARKNWAASEDQVVVANAKLMTMLAGTSGDIYDAVILEQKIPQLMVGEAKEKNCNYILSIDEFNSDIGKGGFFDKIKDSLFKGLISDLTRKIKDQMYRTSGGNLSRTTQELNLTPIFEGFTAATKKKNKVTIVYSLFGVKENKDLLTKSVKVQTAAANKENILERVLIDVGSDALSCIPVNN